MAQSKEIRGIPADVFEYPNSGRPRANFWEGLSELGILPQPRSLEPGTAGSDSTSDSICAVAVTPESSFETGRQQGIREAQEHARVEQNNRIREIEAKRAAQVAELANCVAQEREKFLEMAEPDVVQLSLAIAERILRREAQVDPLFLVGAVRVALGQLAQSLHVRLRIPSPEAEIWGEAISRVPNLKVKPEIVCDPAMEAGDCAIESEMGSAELGLYAQLDTMRHALLGEPMQSRGRDERGRTPQSNEGGA